MGLSSGGIGILSAGAGRSYQIMWPPQSDTWNNGSGPSQNMTGRLGFSGVSNGISITNIATGVTQFFSYSPGTPGTFVASDSTLGSPAVMLKNLAAGDQNKVGFNQGYFLGYEGEKLGAGIQPDRFFHVARFIVRGCFRQLAGAINQTTTDIGLMIVPGNVASMNMGANRPGYQFGPTDVGVYTLRARKSFAAAYDFSQDFTAAALGLPDPAETWCTYEMRIIGADNGKPAQYKMFVNEVQIGPTISISPTDGRAPGPSASGGGFNGLNFNIINSNGGTYIWLVKYMCLILCPDEGLNS